MVIANYDRAKCTDLLIFLIQRQMNISLPPSGSLLSVVAWNPSDSIIVASELLSILEVYTLTMKLLCQAKTGYLTDFS